MKLDLYIGFAKENDSMFFKIIYRIFVREHSYLMLSKLSSK